MIKKTVAALALVLTFVVSVLVGQESAFGQETNKSYYLIGNSLTWDTVPSKLDGDVQWHVDCGKSLPWMFDHPEKPCVKSSQLWPDALKKKQYDYISFQPHYGSTLESDIETISKWIGMQKTAIVVIHSGWARSKTRAEEFVSPLTSKMIHSPQYVSELTEALQKKFPQRTFRHTRTTELLNRIAADIKKGKSPFKKIEELYRDPIHMKHESGRYLMHNAMRTALDQPISDRGFKTSEEHKKYFGSILASFKKPASAKSKN